MPVIDNRRLFNTIQYSFVDGQWIIVQKLEPIGGEK